MKKLWGFFLVFISIICAFNVTTTVKADGDYQIEKYHAQADIQKNGDIELTQRINYQFDGDFHGVYYNQNIQGIKGATDPQVFIKNGSKETPLVQSDSGQENTFKVTRTKDSMGLKVYHSASTENLTFIYKYRLLGAVTNYQDTAELNWKMIGGGWDKTLHNVILTVNLPQGDVSKLQAWTHGPSEGYTDVNRKQGQVKMTLDKLPAHQVVETHMIFPTSVTADNLNVVNKKRKSQVLAQEKQLVLDANAQRERKKMIYRVIMAFGAIVVLLIYLVRFYQFRKYPGNKHVIPTPLHHYFDEPDFLPSFTKVVLDKTDRADSLSLTADLLVEVGQRRMKIDKVKRSYEITALVPPTNPFFKYLIEEIGDGQKVSLKQIKLSTKGSGKKARRLGKKFEKWSKVAAKGREKYLDLDNLNIVKDFQLAAISTSIIVFLMWIVSIIFAKNILISGALMLVSVAIFWIIYIVAKHKVTPYTDEGEDEVNKIRAFKRMLKDIDDIKMAEVGDLILWEQLLPYAVVFGVSDKVIKALKVNFSAEQLDNSLVIPYYIGAHSFINSSSSGFQSSFTSAISSGNGSSSSVSGGSGGFSGGSSGGFGGGSGGGAF
ncbi:DUF2207 domain-containing protein [Companilactobacillus nantensis]|uniref:Integral membrane protein n=1 Tax=Companilactobacillus nantensis DSM 16982 TaxID=1423774 RepID=A0A0R1WAN5_9LACO|nr:DUF2207 domain-containing protein [Companilactobacillus nantensis]KRM15006.1 integral membrane protein [Companilactobacillus nantensis DSM 16982]GEO64961.1 membrane protein [Companilactobacillus nantensis]